MAAKKRLSPVRKTFREAFRNYRPPEELTVSQWAERYRVLSPESAAEAGPWRNERTPYMVEPMDAITDPEISTVAVVAMSQVGKSEMELNALGYIIDQDPAPTMYIQPTLDDARRFSRLRIAPMIRDCRRLRRKVADVRGRDASNSTLQKSFPGGMLFLIGAQSPAALASTPARFVLGDEIDRWVSSAGSEGDPWELAAARTTTFYNRKIIGVSTPTTKGQSRIEALYNQGTQERWYTQCPSCGEWHEIDFDDIKFDFDVIKKSNSRKSYHIKWVSWCCPGCGVLHTEAEMRKQPSKWVAENPDARKNGCRSFWVNGFSSPWRSWDAIVLKFLESKDDPLLLKVFYNTILGKLWEDRGDLDDEDTMMDRREDYGTRDDGTPVELPKGVLVLTCGVDTQDDRLEYEVAGWGHYYESWGIKRGILYGDPNGDEVWMKLDDVLRHQYRFADGMKMRISRTFVDSGGHKTQSVYRHCRERENMHVYAIKGSNDYNAPLTKPPSKVKIVTNGRAVAKAWLYTIGVSAAKADLLKGALKVLEPGPRYCHFPVGKDAGYDYAYFQGLLSEVETKTACGKPVWKKLPGHERNEPLDLRNYAYAAFSSLGADMDAVEQRLREAGSRKNHDIVSTQQPRKTRTHKNSRLSGGDDW